MKTLSTILFIHLLFTQDFESFKKKEIQDFKTFITQYDNMLDYLNRESDEFKKIENEIFEIWGDKNVASSKTWIGYSKDKKQRIMIDFENQITTIQIKSEKSPVEALKDSKSFLKNIETSHQNDKKIISDNVDLNNEIMSSKLKTLSKEKVTTYEIKLPFKKSAFNNLVLDVMPFVKKYSIKYKLDPRRVLAQIHAESAFNPRAISTANAYGLMQLVPRYGGKEANYFLTGNNKNPDLKELFNPEKNIELGCTYIHILNTKYFHKITSSESLEYLTISAYNTGPENVYRSFDKKNKEQSLSMINNLHPKDLYSHLIINLPHLETRNYLKIVLQKKKLYTKI